MTDQATAEAPADNTPMTLDEAAAAYSERRKEPAAESATEPATAETELADEASAAPAEQATGETQEAAPAEKPSRDLPRSWTKDRADVWNALTPEAQDVLLDQDRAASEAVRRSQNEAAEARKAFEARTAEVAADREKQLAALASQDQSLDAELAQKFPNIKTMADVNFLANEALRLSQTGNHDDMAQAQQVQAYLTAWNTLQQQIATVKRDRSDVEKKQETDRTTKWTSHVQEENVKFQESLSNADKGKLKGFLEAAPAFLMERGFTDQELGNLANGKDRLSIYDHRVQAMILDGMKYRDLQKAPPQAIKTPVPPVQRPGAKQPSGAVNDAKIQALRNKVNDTGSLDDAFDLYRARKAANS